MSDRASTPHRPPSGSKDLMPLEVVQKQWIEETLQRIFHSWGYQRIITSTLERLETLTAGGMIRGESVLQLRDREGVMLGLRPELTVPIVRAAATRMVEAPLPQRLYYLDNVFRNTQREQEFFQAGVELIGAGGWLADAEILILLAEGLEHLQIGVWTLILGDVSITESLLSLLSPTARVPLRRAIAQLDQVNLHDPSLSEPDRQIAQQILELRGDPSQVFSRLLQLSLPAPQRERVSELQQLCQLLEKRGVRIVLDLSLLQTFAYYTGIVFQAVVGTEVVGLGGRYDQLFSLYSPDRMQRPGIGFMMILEQLQRVLALKQKLPTQPPPVYHLVVAVDPVAVPAALDLAQRWRRSDLRVELDLLSRSPEQLEDYARQRQIRQITWVQKDGSYHSLNF